MISHTYMVRQYQKFLVALDGTEFSIIALDDAITLAKKCNASITGLYVIDYLNEFGLDILGPKEDEIKKKADIFLEKAKLRCDEKKVDFIGDIVQGEKGPKIISFAEHNNFDIIIMRRHGKAATRELFFGSVSNYVIHHSKTPVLIIE